MPCTSTGGKVCHPFLRLFLGEAQSGACLETEEEAALDALESFSSGRFELKTELSRHYEGGKYLIITENDKLHSNFYFCPELSGNCRCASEKRPTISLAFQKVFFTSRGPVINTDVDF